MSRALFLVLLLCAGCSATTVPVQGLRFPVRAGAGALALTVEDARTETEATALGVRRITMGIPRDVLVAEGKTLSAALAEALTASLTKAGYALEPKGKPLTVRVKQLAADGYFGELTVEYDVELALGDAKPVGRSGKRVSAYKGEEGYVIALSEALTAVVTDLLAAGPIAGAGAPPPECVGCKKPLKPEWVACPHCGKKRG